MGATLTGLIKREKRFLTGKEPHTSHKIRYICRYVREWLRAACRAGCRQLNFIDCMANTGIYADGDLFAGLEVLKLFIETAPRFPEKTFYVLFNDHRADAVRIGKEVCGLLWKTVPPNVRIRFEQLDANLFLQTLRSRHDLFGAPARTILYVSPYGAGTVRLPILKKLLQKTYCELIYSFSSSDAVRAGLDCGITKAFGGPSEANSEELANGVAELLSVGFMKYRLSYSFRSKQNTELYRLLFLTTHSRGPDQFKRSIWATFQGTEHYRIERIHAGQISLFTPQDGREYWAKTLAQEALDLLRSEYRGKTIRYVDIEQLILPRSLLMSSQLIKYLIKPNIDAGNIVKRNRAKTRKNYKDDYYLIK